MCPPHSWATTSCKKGASPETVMYVSAASGRTASSSTHVIYEHPHSSVPYLHVWQRAHVFLLGMDECTADVVLAAGQA